MYNGHASAYPNPAVGVIVAQGPKWTRADPCPANFGDIARTGLDRCLEVRFTPPGPQLPGTIWLRGGRTGQFVTDQDPNVRTDARNLGAWERFAVVQLGGGQIALRGGRQGKYCSDDGDNRVRCNRDAVGAWERFTVEDAGGGRIALRGGRTGRYCSDQEDRFSCDAMNRNAWEVFQYGQA